MKRSLVLLSLFAATAQAATTSLAIPTSFNWTLKRVNSKVATGVGPEVNCWNKAAADAAARTASAVYNCTFVAAATVTYIPSAPAPGPAPAPAPAPITNDPLWPFAVTEPGSFAVVGTQLTRFGANGVWIEKSFTDQTVLCTSGTYGKDPLTGVTKSCYVQAPLVVVLPPVIDHSGMGPTVDPALIPAPAVGYSTARVRSTWRTTGDVDCTPGSPNCAIPAAYVPTGPQTIGAFRIPVGFAKMLYDDPIVYPGIPGKSHLHTFTGNTGVDAFTTTSSILTGNSTSDGGTLNRSSYWFPTMVDTANGKPLVPSTNVVYYKGSYEFDISSVVQPLPTGLRMIAGNAKNIDPTKTGAQYACVGGPSISPWFKTITALVGNASCTVGADMLMAVSFPLCWDGVNLDSPNHSSHMSGVVQDGPPNFAKHCPATHPVVVPEISYNIHYRITDAGMVGRLRLSSDMDPTLPAGISGHADYFLGWDATTMQTFVTNCIKAKMDCHADVLGNETTLY